VEYEKAFDKIKGHMLFDISEGKCVANLLLNVLEIYTNNTIKKEKTVMTQVRDQQVWEYHQCCVINT
jgi:hypothetical protein